MHVIAKAINTVNRRLRVGDPVCESDDLTPHSFEGLKAAGFISEVKSASASAPTLGAFARDNA